MDKIIAVMLRAHGLDVSRFDEAFLEKSLEKRREAVACESAEAYLKRLLEDRAEAEAFYRSLRVSYSVFFRNPLAFALLEQTILPDLLNEKQRAGQTGVRIWSAGCAAGQEAWSVAILLDELTVAQSKQAAYRIFATDLSEPDLALARAGVYGAESLGNVRLRHLGACFSRQGEAYVIAPRLRERVEISLYDLLDQSTTCPSASIYGDFDLVLCSNVLLYHRPKMQRLILDKVRRCLATPGYLIVGEAEREIVESAGGFRAVAPPATVFHKRVRIK